jgi:putative ABC transport system ATP-binding protein
MTIVQELNSVHGKTIVFVTHEPDIASFSKRTITLKDGKIIRDMVNPVVRSAKEVLAGLPVVNEPLIAEK